MLNVQHMGADSSLQLRCFGAKEERPLLKRLFP